MMVFVNPLGQHDMIKAAINAGKVNGFLVKNSLQPWHPGKCELACCKGNLSQRRKDRKDGERATWIELCLALLSWREQLRTI